MNGYKLIADSYRHLIAKGKIDKNIAEKEIRIFDFLSTCDEDDIGILFNSGAFNEIMKGYLNAIIADAEVNNEIAYNLKESARWVLDTKSAADVLK